MFSDLEGEFSSPFISVTLLSALGCLQVSRTLATFSTASSMASGPKKGRSPTSNYINGVLHFLPYKASNGDILRLA